MNRTLALSLSLLILLPLTSVQANMAEMFGPTARSIGLGNQFTADSFDAGNNHHAPALLAFSDRFTFSYSNSLVAPKFKSIDNVVIANEVTDTLSTSDTIGSVPTDYGNAWVNQIHLSVPLLRPAHTIIGLSLYSPVQFIQESSTGDAFTPEYVMYRARYQRTYIAFNIANQLSEHWAFSLGAYSGFQTSAETNINSSVNGVSGPSYGKMKFQAKPSLSPIASIVYKQENAISALTYQHSMKSRLKTYAVGTTNNDPLNFPYDFEFNSMLYFDPAVIRLSQSYLIGQMTLVGTVEYQIWDEYQTPVATIVQRGGVIRPSSQFEQIDPRNIFVPKLGFDYRIKDNVSLRSGVFYRPTPLAGDFSGAGNSIDTDVLGYNLGGGYDFTLLSYEIGLDLGLQYQSLRTKTITKSTGREDGSSGNKIGSSQYQIGGEIMAASVGVRVKF